MFALPLFSFASSLATTFSPKSEARKNYLRKITDLTSTGLFLLLTGLPMLTMAEDVAPMASDSSASSEKTTTQKNNDAENQTGRVARAIFTSAIADREPVDNLTTVSGDIKRIYFFSDLRGLAGQIVTHRWEYDGKVMAEVTFKVGKGARWRVYSSKNLVPEWTGQWTVVVSNEGGQPLETSTFEYTPETMNETTSKTTQETSSEPMNEATAPVSP